ncbi:DHX38 [Mytilus edulis]|uniref:DHX38 n=1 Tax=Mytilus edulis TaxID=6550 RepID=A0A8S3VIQ3_MYTED|nr:DHX38 [Mytilus edulis]
MEATDVTMTIYIPRMYGVDYVFGGMFDKKIVKQCEKKIKEMEKEIKKHNQIYKKLQDQQSNSKIHAIIPIQTVVQRMSSKIPVYHASVGPYLFSGDLLESALNEANINNFDFLDPPELENKTKDIYSDHDYYAQKSPSNSDSGISMSSSGHAYSPQSVSSDQQYNPDQQTNNKAQSGDMSGSQGVNQTILI